MNLEGYLGMDIVKYLESITPRIKALADEIRMDDQRGREHLDSYNKLILPLCEKKDRLRVGLRERKSIDTGKSLTDDQVISHLQGYVDAVIDENQAKVKYPYDEGGLREAERELIRYQGIKAMGEAGLIQVCQNAIRIYPRQPFTGEFDDFWETKAAIWGHYQEVVKSEISKDFVGLLGISPVPTEAIEEKGDFSFQSRHGPDPLDYVRGPHLRRKNGG